MEPTGKEIVVSVSALGNNLPFDSPSTDMEDPFKMDDGSGLPF